MIEVRNLVHRFDDGTEALRGVTFGTCRGEHLGIVGPSGAGKSTLLLHLNGVLQPTSGSVVLDGVEVDQLHAPEVRRRVGLVFQDPDDMLFTTRLADDVSFGPLHLGLSADEVDRRMRAALAATGLADLADRVPQRLSFGQKRLGSIAAVLAMQPDVLVLDEPTSGLDPRGRRRLVEVLRAFDRTLVIATHDLELVVALCPRTLILDGGAVAADGPTDSVLRDEDLLRDHGLERPHSFAPLASR